MKTVLVITSSIDVTVDYIIKKYQNEAQFCRLNIDELSKYRIDVDKERQWIITCSNWALEKSSVCSIYYRKPILPNLAEFEKDYHGMIAKDIISLINGIVDDFDGRVLTKPYILRKTENKIFQLLYAARKEFQLPESYIVNSKSRALECIKNSKSIIKPLTTGKIKKCDGIELYQTNYITELQDDIDLTPVYVQKYEEKNYEVRLTCVNGSMFAVRIDSEDKLDWRKNYSGLKYSLIECPKAIKKRCFKLMEDFDLHFGAFDFIVNKQNEWIFLEVNPNGQWMWLEKALDIPISQQIFRYLVE
jgi:hypothetical protein